MCENICVFPALKTIFSQGEICTLVQEILLAVAPIGLSRFEFQGGILQRKRNFAALL